MNRLVVAALSGLSINAAFPNWNLWPLAFIGVALLWWALDGRDAKASFAIGWVAGVAFFAPHVWWAYVSVGFAPWIALVLVEGMAVGVMAACWAHVTKSQLLDTHVWLDAPVFALLWVGVEQLRSIVPFGGFPWGRIAFSQVDSPLGGLAAFGGVPLVSYATVVSGVWLGLGVAALRDRRVLEGILAPLAAVGTLVVGSMTPSFIEAPSGTLWVGAVQGNVPNLGLDSFRQARLVTTNHHAGTLALMDRGIGELDLMVWPENAADFDPRSDAETFDLVTDAARASGVPLLVGTVDYSPPQGRYNTALLITADGTVLDIYHKQRPAPFAEYIPMRTISRAFSPAVDRVRTDMLAGTEPGVMVLPLDRLGRDVALGVVICFEVAYDSIVTDAVREGAEILIVQTNNANFGMTAESTQQLAMSRMRAIETGRSTIQISTVGVSAMIAPDGRVLQRTGLFTAEQMYSQLTLHEDITPAVRHAAFIQWAFLLGPAGLAAWAMYRRLEGAYEWE